MRPLRSHAKAASPSAPSSPTAVMADDGSSATPAPSPSTSVSFGLGSAADDDESLKSPGVAPPRRSLRLAGAASPVTPTAGSSVRNSASSGAGAGSKSGVKRRGRPRVSNPDSAAAASPKDGKLGSNGGGGVRALGGGGGSSGSGHFRSLRSRSRIAKSPLEQDAHMIGEMVLGSDGEVREGDQVHDEMLHPNAEGTTKQHKSILVGGNDYMSDSGSDLDENCLLPAKRCKIILVGGVEHVTDSRSDDNADYLKLGEDGVKIQAQFSTDAKIEPGVVSVSTHMADEGRNDGSVKAGKGETREASKKEDLLSEESMPSHDSADETDGRPVSSPVGISATDEVYVDMYFNEQLNRQGKSTERGKGIDKLVLVNNGSVAGVSVDTRAGARTLKFSSADKGKGKMVVDDNLLSQSSSDDKIHLESVVPEETQSISRALDAPVEPLWKQAARQRAIKLAPKFALFKVDKDEHSDDDDAEELEPVADPQDWPGPFSTAQRIIDDRDAKLRARELNPFNADNCADNAILWIPSKDKKAPVQSAPSLTSLCLQTLSNNADGIESLGGICDVLKHKLLRKLCCSRKMTTHLLSELLCDDPVTLQLSECSWLSEDDFGAIFGKCRTEVLEVLQLDLSGRCMPDYMLPVTLAKVPNCMPVLREVSLMGNYRLSDKGLDTIVSAAPSLSSLNLSECSLLTSTGIENLANKLYSGLRELYIDDCLNVDAMMILPSLQKIKHLEVLSMCGIQSVCDKFVTELIAVQGSNIRELAFAGCLKLTSSSIKIIGGNCSQLSSLDLRNLNRLRDSAMRHLRSGCRLMKKLKLQRNTFSDEAVSQFLEESGGCLTELSLNNIEKAGNLTARAIALTCASCLEVLDLSFCRELTNEAVGLIVDSCSSLRILKLFGCTQITDVFLKGHSNPLVKIIGIEGSIMEQMDSC